MHTSRFYPETWGSASRCSLLRTALRWDQRGDWQGLLINKRDDSVNSRKKQTECNRWILDEFLVILIISGANYKNHKTISENWETFSSFCTVSGLFVTDKHLHFSWSIFSVYLQMLWNTSYFVFSECLDSSVDSSSWAVRTASYHKRLAPLVWQHQNSVPDSADKAEDS